MGKNARQSGAVSLFAVIFGAMLLTIVTIGFIKLMIMDQRQSSNNDLSQSAWLGLRMLSVWFVPPRRAIFRRWEC